MRKVDVGDYVYGFDSYGNLHEGKVRLTEICEGVTFVRFGHYSVLREDTVFLSKEECMANHIKNFEEQVKKYMQGINSVEDLVRFGYNNSVSLAEEYTDWEAREAYKRKTEELLGVDVTVYQ